MSRASLPFRAVNRIGTVGYQPEMQRHHIVPRQLVGVRCFQPLFRAVGPEVTRFDDFRANGLLLPASSRAALRSGLPLHRGPHRHYSELVRERLGQIEQGWAGRRGGSPLDARREAAMRLQLLQAALRRSLMQRKGPASTLNRKDPFRAGVDFRALDAMADAIWSATAAHN